MTSEIYLSPIDTESPPSPDSVLLISASSSPDNVVTNGDSPSPQPLIGSSPPPPPPPPPNILTTIDRAVSLEERVRELETKLAVVSRLLQLQASANGSDHFRSSVRPSRSPTPPRLPVREGATRQLRENGSSMSTPKRNEKMPVKKNEEDPGTERRRNATVSDHKRNLSFSLLFDGNESEYDQKRQLLESTHATDSMTASERHWLQPKILEYQRNHERTVKSPERDEHPKQSAPNPLEPDDSARSNWLNYLNSFQETNVDVDVQMQEFIQVPQALESLMSFGLFICVDSFLYMITILPIRFVWSSFLLLLKIGVWIRKRQRASTPYRFHRRHTYQLIQVMILYTIYRYVLSAISIGVVYHWIRGQSMIKLYVLVAMVEVFDRLFSSLGQDALESMYWNTVNRPRSSRMVVSVAVVWVYAVLHSLLLFAHVATLNVAMNSADQALLTLLISGNFAEIKSTVFKKYNKPALFKIAASDICERFKLGLFLSLVMLLNLFQGMDKGQRFDYLRICGYVWCAELISDWIKHSFITKFNFLPSRVYREYALLLAGDVTGIGHEGVNLDHSHAVVKRIGFAQIPLVCVLFRMLREAFKYALMSPNYERAIKGRSSWLIAGGATGGWVLLLLVKMALGGLLQRKSLAKLRAAPQMIAIDKKGKKKSI